MFWVRFFLVFFFIFLRYPTLCAVMGC
jgi:hypothetical protein